VDIGRFLEHIHRRKFDNTFSTYRGYYKEFSSIILIIVCNSYRIVLAKILVVEKTIKLAALTVIMMSGLTLLTPISMLSTALAQPVVTEVSEPGVKPNEYYIFT